MLIGFGKRGWIGVAGKDGHRKRIDSPGKKPIHLLNVEGAKVRGLEVGGDEAHEPREPEPVPLIGLGRAVLLTPVEEGIDELDYVGPIVKRTEHKAGVMKIAGSSGGPSLRDEKVFAAAAMAASPTS